MAADGMATNEIARQCGTTADSVRSWRRRFTEQGVEGGSFNYLGALSESCSFDIGEAVMANQISWVLSVAVKNGELDNFRTLMQEMVTSTRDEPGAQGYEWFIDPTESTVEIYERYADSEATMTHLGNFGANFAERFLSSVDPVSLHVYGDPSDEVKEILDGFGAAYLGSFGGFFR